MICRAGPKTPPGFLCGSAVRDPNFSQKTESVFRSTPDKMTNRLVLFFRSWQQESRADRNYTFHQLDGGTRANLPALEDAAFLLLGISI